MGGGADDELLARRNLVAHEQLESPLSRLRGAQVDVNSLVGLDVSGNPKLALDRVETVFLAGQVSDTTRYTLDRETSNPQIIGATLDDPVNQVNLRLLTGLVLGSPEFQKR